MAEEVRQLGADIVGPVRNLAAAVETAEREQVDLALLDVNLDGELVYPLAEVLQAKGVPFVFLTGYDEEILPLPWRDRPRLAKPVNPRTLREELLKLGG